MRVPWRCLENLASHCCDAFSGASILGTMTSESGVLLDRVLRPSPPLSPHSLIAVLTLVALLNLAIILFFVGKGAWPVAPFMGADLALLAWAFRASSIAAGREER